LTNGNWGKLMLVVPSRVPEKTSRRTNLSLRTKTCVCNFLGRREHLSGFATGRNETPNTPIPINFYYLLKSAWTAAFLTLLLMKKACAFCQQRAGCHPQKFLIKEKEGGMKKCRNTIPQ